MNDEIEKQRADAHPVPLHNYPVKAELFMHQIRGANMAAIAFGLNAPPEKIRAGFAFFMEMGCGKTVTAIAVAGQAYEMGRVKRLLIVAPASVCFVWEKEFEAYAAFLYTARMLTGSHIKRSQALANMNGNGLLVVIINYESVWRLLHEIMAWRPQMVIADESQRIKTPYAKQSKAMHILGDIALYKLALSGTPIQNQAVDLYSQFRFLDTHVFGSNFYVFRSRYARMGGFNQRQIVGYKNLNELKEKTRSISYRVTKLEALDLPEQVFETRYLRFSELERRVYNNLSRSSCAALQSGGTITAAMVLTKLLRLQQMTGGFTVLDDTKEIKTVNTRKMDALIDLLMDFMDTGKKLVIFCRFIPEIIEIEKRLVRLKISYRCLWGITPPEDRAAYINDFQADPLVTVFLAQIQTAGVGVTLTAADTAVYYSMDFNYANYVQSLARIHRIGQRNTCTYINFVVKDTIDEKVLDAMTAKKSLADFIMDDWASFFKTLEERE